MDFFRDALTSAYRIETLFYLFWTLNPQDLSIPLQMGLAASVLLRPKNPRIKSASPSNLNHITLRTWEGTARQRLFLAAFQQLF